MQRYYGDIDVSLNSDPSRAQVFVDALLDNEPNYLDADFRHTLCIHTGGNPLFTVELLHTLRERGTLVKDRGRGWVHPPDRWLFPVGAGLRSLLPRRWLSAQRLLAQLAEQAAYTRQRARQ